MKILWILQVKQNKIRSTLDEFRKTFLPGHNVDEDEGGEDGEYNCGRYLLSLIN